MVPARSIDVSRVDTDSIRRLGRQANVIGSIVIECVIAHHVSKCVIDRRGTSIHVYRGSGRTSVIGKDIVLDDRHSQTYRALDSETVALIVVKRVISNNCRLDSTPHG